MCNCRITKGIENYCPKSTLIVVILRYVKLCIFFSLHILKNGDGEGCWMISLQKTILGPCSHVVYISWQQMTSWRKEPAPAVLGKFSRYSLASEQAEKNSCKCKKIIFIYRFEIRIPVFFGLGSLSLNFNYLMCQMKATVPWYWIRYWRVLWHHWFSMHGNCSNDL